MATPHRPVVHLALASKFGCVGQNSDRSSARGQLLKITAASPLQAPAPPPLERIKSGMTKAERQGYSLAW